MLCLLMGKKEVSVRQAEQVASWEATASVPPNDKGPPSDFSRALQVAAERRRKAATQPSSIAEGALAALEPALLPAAQGASATEDSSLNGTTSGAAEQGQQEHVQSEEATLLRPDTLLRSSPSDCIEKQLNHATVGTLEQEDSRQVRSVSPALESHSKEDEANEDYNCNGLHATASAEAPQQADGLLNTDSPPAASRAPQQPATAPKEGAALLAAVQERQQRLMQSLLEGCDELADDHLQVCILSGAQLQAEHPIIAYHCCRCSFQLKERERDHSSRRSCQSVHLDLTYTAYKVTI